MIWKSLVHYGPTRSENRTLNCAVCRREGSVTTVSLDAHDPRLGPVDDVGLSIDHRDRQGVARSITHESVVARQVDARLWPSSWRCVEQVAHIPRVQGFPRERASAIAACLGLTRLAH